MSSKSSKSSKSPKSHTSPSSPLILSLKTTPAFANAARRLFIERNKGCLFRLSDKFRYTSDMKTFDVGLSYTTPTFHKTDFNPYDPPEKMTMVWELRPPPLESGFETVPVPGKSMVCEDGKYHFEVPPNSMIARLQPSNIYTDIEYELETKRAEEDYRFTQLICSYSYDGENVNDDSPTNIKFMLRVINSTLNRDKYLADLALDIYVYLQQMRIFFETYDNVAAISVAEVENSVDITIADISFTLSAILRSQTPQMLDYETISFTTYQKHIIDRTVKIRIDRILDPDTGKPLKPKNSSRSAFDPKSVSGLAWNKIISEMIDNFAEQFRRTFKFKGGRIAKKSTAKTTTKTKPKTKTKAKTKPKTKKKPKK